MIDAANKNGGKDNITAGDRWPEVKKWVFGYHEIHGIFLA